MAINMFEGARRTLIIVGFGLLVTAGCSGQATPEDSVFTLYQNSPSDVGARVGVATFDMKVSDPRFNYVECQEGPQRYIRQTGSQKLETNPIYPQPRISNTGARKGGTSHD